MAFCPSPSNVGFDRLSKVVSVGSGERTVCLDHLAPLMSVFHKNNAVKGKSFWYTRSP